MRVKKIAALIIMFLLFSSVCFAQDNPQAPKDLLANVKDSSVMLTWTPPMDTSVIGFNVYKKEDLKGGEYSKLNKNIISSPSYRDKDVKKGVSYAYICKAVNSDGIESKASNIAGAPKMKMDTSAVVTHMGRPVRIAVPGDVIKYNVDFANNGYGLAKNVVIVYAIPKGTQFISGTAKCPKFKAEITYFDEKAGKWVESVDEEENISKVRFTVLEDVAPVSKGNNGTASLKVMIQY